MERGSSCKIYRLLQLIAFLFVSYKQLHSDLRGVTLDYKDLIVAESSTSCVVLRTDSSSGLWRLSVFDIVFLQQFNNVLM